MTWKKDSWRSYEKKHIPNYSDIKELNRVESVLEQSSPLVFTNEINSLYQNLKDISKGNGFLLHGGDCAESFTEFNADNIESTFKVVLQMAIILTAGIKVPITKIGRIAGQFAKPRTNSTETIDDLELPSYKGDIINDIAFNQKLRQPDPNRMLKAYSQSASTIALLKSFSDRGYSDLKHLQSWNMEFVKNHKQEARYQHLTNQIKDSLKFMETLGLISRDNPHFKKVEYFISHEALLLPYEEALTRIDSKNGKAYNTAAHFVWIGDRTRFIKSAHVEYCKGISNPIGIKCGPTLTSDELIRLLDILNPNDISGKITLITRFGNDNIEAYLPNLIRTVEKEGRSVIWSCDPMHGNTIKGSNNGIKTRPFDRILDEVRKNFDIHKAEGTNAGGIHLEMTGQNVTECTGGIDEISEEDLSNRYRTHCDPRLNANQAIEMAFLITDKFRNSN